jgi:hypothetical protein
MIKLILSAADMGDVTEADFDAWAAFVCNNIDAGVGFVVDDVDQHRFGHAGEDTISGATDEQREAVRTWLSVTGWEEFCATPEAWPHEAAARGRGVSLSATA